MDDIKRNGSGYYDPTAYMALKNVQKGKKMVVCRGDIYFVCKGNNRATGSEQDYDRPALIVSNNKCNEYSQVVEVVYLTSEEKKPLPTHVDIMCRIPSIALCEQIHSVSKLRLTEYVRTCSDAEMQKVDQALMISLGIESGTAPDSSASMEIEDLKRKCTDRQYKNDELMMRLEGAERKLDELNAENAGLVLENGDLKEKLKMAEQQIPVFPVEIEKELLKAETQRDMYKELYDQMLEKMMG